ncbi:MAG: LUD domain-containing protein [Prevotellaceae bacterium]|nr:LUD domain-containing protein [Prevotellaceae bacterium]
MSTQHSINAMAYQKNPDIVAHHDQTFWNVRAKRDKMAKALPEWEELRETANLIKKHTITHLAEYLQKFEAAATANGVHVHWAKDADEYNEIVYGILKQHDVKKVVKSKSMLTEECHLNKNLESKGIDVVETDLGERILQLMELPPSHIVMPALHVHKEDIRDCFMAKIPEYEEFKKKYFELKQLSPNETDTADPTMLTFIARLHLRNQFMTADAGMTGGNFGIAETGDVVVCTNEGNADMSTSIPPLHIVSIGLEKLIPNYKAMAVFQRLLARCGTGQETTVYTSHFRGPKPGGEMHIVLVDNGRSRNVGNEEHWQTLKCMRCGACMNTCPVYRRSAGYSYTYFIPGPIGVNLGMLKDAKKYSDNVSACSLCMSCDNVCPVKVDLSSQIYKWRQGLDDLGKANQMKKMMSKGMSTLFNNPSLYTTALKFAPLANCVPSCLMNIKCNTWAYGHKMMTFPKKSFHAMWKKGEVK